MKRIVVAFIMVSLLLASVAFADDNACSSSGKKASDEIIATFPATLCGIRAYTNGTNNTTCTVYDGTSAAGTIVGEWTTLGSNISGGDNGPVGGVTALKGLYLDITTTAGSCIIYYK